jgi:hypothetical protein
MVAACSGRQTSRSYRQWGWVVGRAAFQRQTMAGGGGRVGQGFVQGLGRGVDQQRSSSKTSMSSGHGPSC